MLATAWLDIVFAPLMVLGIETIDAGDGGYGESVIHADYTHSLIGALVLSATFGLVCARWWNRRSAVVLAAVVFSHWLLDLLVHRSDMPLLPGDLGHLPHLGLGLWRYPVISTGLELALVVVGAYAYWRAATRASRAAGGTTDGRARWLGAGVLGVGLVTLALDVLAV